MRGPNKKDFAALSSVRYKACCRIGDLMAVTFVKLDDRVDNLMLASLSNQPAGVGQ